MKTVPLFKKYFFSNLVFNDYEEPSIKSLRVETP